MIILRQKTYATPNLNLNKFGNTMKTAGNKALNVISHPATLTFGPMIAAPIIQGVSEKIAEKKARKEARRQRQFSAVKRQKNFIAPLVAAGARVAPKLLASLPKIANATNAAGTAVQGAAAIKSGVESMKNSGEKESSFSEEGGSVMGSLVKSLKPKSIY